MAVQKSKKTKSRRNMRRSHDSINLNKINKTIDKTSGEEHLYHHISAKGFYKGNQVIEIKQKKPKENKNQEN